MRKKLENWMRRQFFADTEHDDGRVSKLVLRHAAGKGGDVQTFPLKKVPDETKLESLLNDIEQAAQDDAEGLGGLQKYVLIAIRQGTGAAGGRFSFNMQGSDDSDEDAFNSEPASLKGIASQQMRHNEIIMRTSVMATNQVITTLQRTISRQADLIEKMEADRAGTFQLMEELQSQKHERDIQTANHLHKQEVQKELLGKVTLLLPSVINKLTGKKVMKEGASPEAMAIKEFMASLKPQQMEALSSILAPEQLISIMNMYESVREVEPTTAIARRD